MSDGLPAELAALSDSEIDALPPDQVRQALSIAASVVRRGELRAWRSTARPEQLPPDGPWRRLFLRGGRGSGKSWASTHIFAELIDEDPLKATEGPGEWAIIAPTFGDGRSKCVEGESSGLLRALGTNRAEVDAGRSARVERWNRSTGELRLRDGSVVYVDGADDGALRIQGFNLRGALCDEIGLWRQWETAWNESLGYALRKGESRIVACGTPKKDRAARELVRTLLRDSDVITRRLRTEDNRANLSESFWREVTKTAGSRLGRQELEGELLEDVEGALWTPELIDRHRRADPPYSWIRRRVAIDPSDGTATGAEQGVAVVGLGSDWGLYLLESHGLRTNPYGLCKAAIRISERQDRASIVIEKNHGGRALVDLLEMAMKELGRRVPFQVVTATQSKMVRAEPVAALFEQEHRGVHFLGHFPELEEQMTTYTGVGKSPDRLDAFVHGILDLMRGGIDGPTTGDPAEPVPWSDRRKPGGAVPWDDGSGATFSRPTGYVTPFGRYFVRDGAHLTQHGGG